jgi:hypothetical protein
MKNIKDLYNDRLKLQFYLTSTLHIEILQNQKFSINNYKLIFKLINGILVWLKMMAYTWFSTIE